MSEMVRVLNVDEVKAVVADWLTSGGTKGAEHLRAQLEASAVEATHWKHESDLRSGIINHLQTMLAEVRAQLAAVEQERNVLTLSRDGEVGARKRAEGDADRLRGGLFHAKIGAARLADEVAALVRRGVLDSRSPAADALLDYRNPPSSERADRLAAAEQRVAALTEAQREADKLLAAIESRFVDQVRAIVLLSGAKAHASALEEVRKVRAALRATPGGEG